MRNTAQLKRAWFQMNNRLATAERILLAEYETEAYYRARRGWVRCVGKRNALANLIDTGFTC